MRLLVTGGSGFIGRWLCEQLVRQGHELINLDLCAPDWAAPYKRVVLGDVRDARAVRDAIEGCSAVYHLAAAHHDTGIDVGTYFDVNENGMRVLLAAMDEARVSRISFTSTVAVYGDSDRVPTEGSATRPRQAYGASKLAAERVLREWAAQDPQRAAFIVRPSVVFGAHNFANMYSLIRQIHSGRYVQVGEGANVKSMTYVENLVAFMLRAGFEPGVRTFNYADQPDMTSRQIATAIASALGKSSGPLSLPLWAVLAAMAPVDLFARIIGKELPISGFRIRKFAEFETRFDAAAVRATGFVAPVSLTEGLRRMVGWYQREGRQVAPVWRIPPSAWAGSGASSQAVSRS